jgi:hypothetical protein
MLASTPNQSGNARKIELQMPDFSLALLIFLI